MLLSCQCSAEPRSPPHFGFPFKGHGKLQAPEVRRSQCLSHVGPSLLGSNRTFDISQQLVLNTEAETRGTVSGVFS